MPHRSRKILAMDTHASNLSAASVMRRRVAQAVMVAGLAGLGLAHAAEAPAAAPVAAERPLDLSLPRDTLGKPDAGKEPAEGCTDTKPYGSGYEARCLGATKDKDKAAATAGQASSASSRAGSPVWRGAPAGPGTAAGGMGNRGGAGQRGRR
ncbi:MAG: hypothetical protein Q8K96_05995 [Rubrivivax sp.]|nr:hypothetical protein [Rubrivivax sp.]